MNNICKVITLLLLAICLICHFIYLSYHMKILSDDNKKYLKEIKRQDEMIGYLNNENLSFMTDEDVDEIFAEKVEEIKVYNSSSE